MWKELRQIYINEQPTPRATSDLCISPYETWLSVICCFYFFLQKKLCAAPTLKKREKKSNWKARRAVMSFSVFFVFGQQLNRDQSERATKAQTVENCKDETHFPTLCRGQDFKGKHPGLSFNTVN